VKLCLPITVHVVRHFRPLALASLVVMLHPDGSVALAVAA
jgi:hypothetical protein